jgi:hypothetical protein
MFGHWWTPIVLVRVTEDATQLVTLVLFPTPRVVITVFPYIEFWPSYILPRSGPLMSSPSEGWQLTDYFVTG